MSEIQDVDIAQTITQKARGLGTITVLAVRPTGPETILLEDIPNFREGVEAINSAAHHARLAIKERDSTQRIQHTGVPAQQTFAAQPVVSSGGGSDLNAELSRLADFHKQGILTDEEFSAAKRKLLGL